SVAAYPILGEFVKGFKAAMTAWCPSCKVTDVDQQATDVGTKTPQSVVSTFQRDPKLGYAIFSFGDLTIGVDAALKSAGLSKVKGIAGTTEVVTGAAGGIGTEVCRGLLAEGAKVVAVDLDEGDLLPLAGDGDAALLPVAADVTDAEDTDRFFAAALDRFGSVE